VCLFEFEVTKSVASIDHPETCEKCGAPAERYISRTYFYGAGDWDKAEYNPGLGCITKNSLHRKRICKQRGLEEIGNECPDKTCDHYDRARQKTLEDRWASV
jgi:hypothetical protein